MQIPQKNWSGHHRIILWPLSHKIHGLLGNTSKSSLRHLWKYVKIVLRFICCDLKPLRIWWTALTTRKGPQHLRHDSVKWCSRKYPEIKLSYHLINPRPKKIFLWFSTNIIPDSLACIDAPICRTNDTGKVLDDMVSDLQLFEFTNPWGPRVTWPHTDRYKDSDHKHDLITFSGINRQRKNTNENGNVAYR